MRVQPVRDRRGRREALGAEREAGARLRLASERTYLAWFRTGLTALAVGLGIAKVIPELTGEAALPYGVLGIGFGFLGALLIAYGWWRQSEVDKAVADGEFAPLDPRASASLTVLAVALVTATLVVMVIEG
jgi:putative membrane protein